MVVVDENVNELALQLAHTMGISTKDLVSMVLIFRAWEMPRIVCKYNLQGMERLEGPVLNVVKRYRLVPGAKLQTPVNTSDTQHKALERDSHD